MVTLENESEQQNLKNTRIQDGHDPIKNMAARQMQLQAITNLSLFKSQQFHVGLYFNGLNSVVTFVFELISKHLSLSADMMKTDFKDGCLVAMLFLLGHNHFQSPSSPVE